MNAFFVRRLVSATVAVLVCFCVLEIIAGCVLRSAALADSQTLDRRRPKSADCCQISLCWSRQRAHAELKSTCGARLSFSSLFSCNLWFCYFENILLGLFVHIIWGYTIANNIFAITNNIVIIITTNHTVFLCSGAELPWLVHFVLFLPFLSGLVAFRITFTILALNSYELWVSRYLNQIVLSLFNRIPRFDWLHLKFAGLGPKWKSCLWMLFVFY